MRDGDKHSSSSGSTHPPEKEGGWKSRVYNPLVERGLVVAVSATKDMSFTRSHKDTQQSLALFDRGFHSINPD